ncbi:MAG: tRNA (adenosine(37)-N6)-threonylcarbamoyltransferase complex ATPase subunit type 1 TsaE [Solirubrobacterales bacterium]
MDDQVITTTSAQETESFAATFAEKLGAGDVVLLAGELGSGKTTFVRGAARALGVAGPVTSPTFAIGNIYAGADREIAHLDLFRLDALATDDEAVLEDFLTPNRVSFVEWPHDELRLAARLRAVVTFEHAGGDGRTIGVAWREAKAGEAA